MSDYIILPGVLPNLTEVSVAFWMNTDDKNNYGTPFSYASDDDNDNALVFADYDG